MRRNTHVVNGLARAKHYGTVRFSKKESPMRQICAAALLALTLATPARADLLIEGRAAQALHCAAMLFIVSTELYDLGEISRNSRDTAQRAALVILDQVPGTEDQRRRAMVQRFERIMTSRTPSQLAKEYTDTARWCRSTFLP
ncbi:hypothetical protein D1012_08110 [Pseudotabrizicola alkalilacus]|uniref:Uncharacterized protein n=2 Tax=Pseudotabrizicola alkalilacus TaxID=2305252 RepID=A0A411Z481_9RHOB|nr:hypothetical protein D1012_08110 [Pseudotabrizicola alkalilacus]